MIYVNIWYYTDFSECIQRFSRFLQQANAERQSTIDNRHTTPPMLTCCGAGGSTCNITNNNNTCVIFMAAERGAERFPTSTGTPILLNVAGTTVQVVPAMFNSMGACSLPPAAVRSQVRPQLWVRWRIRIALHV